MSVGIIWGKGFGRHVFSILPKPLFACALNGLTEGQSIKEKYGDRIRKATVEGIRELSNRFSEDIDRGYQKSLEGDVLENENYFRRSVVKYLAETYIPFIFCIKTKDLISAKMKEGYDTQYDEVIHAVREALRLKTVYADAEDFAKGLMERSACLIQSKIKEGAIEMLGEVFSDIYSDVFAIRILKIGMDD